MKLTSQTRQLIQTLRTCTDPVDVDPADEFAHPAKFIPRLQNKSNQTQRPVNVAFALRCSSNSCICDLYAMHKMMRTAKFFAFFRNIIGNASVDPSNEVVLPNSQVGMNMVDSDKSYCTGVPALSLSFPC